MEFPTLDRGAHEYTGSSGYSQKQGHRDWLLIKGNRKRKALSVGKCPGASISVKVAARAYLCAPFVFAPVPCLVSRGVT